MDSFYVREIGAGQITQPARQAAIELALRNAIGQLETF
jgi:hypothetical protein